MALERSSSSDNTARAESHPHALDGKDRTGAEKPAHSEPAVTCGQSVGRAYYQCLSIGEQANDERVEEAQVSAGPGRLADQNGMDPIRRQSFRRRSFATLPTRRPPDPAAAASFRSGWYGGTDRCVSVPSSRRAPSVSATSSVPRARLDMGQGAHQVTLSTSRPDAGDGAENCRHENAGCSDNAVVAAAALVSTRDASSDARGGAASQSRAGLGGGPSNQPEVEEPAAGDEPASGHQTRSQRRLALTNAAMSRLAPAEGVALTASAARARQLLVDFAWSDRTVAFRTSQWKAWVEFCEEDRRPLLPVTEAHFLSFVGWLALEREAGRRSVSASSIPQYLSAVRQMQLSLTGHTPPDYPFVSHVLRAYRAWEEQNFPQIEVRMGVPAPTIQRIWYLGMTESAGLDLVRDAAMVLFAYCLNGLPESSVLSIAGLDVTVSDSALTARLSVVKGHPASQAQLVQYSRLASLPSPLDFWRPWSQARGTHARFFALPGDPVDWRSGGLTQALKRCLERLGTSVAPPPGGKFTSHSLYVGAHTEQVLLGIPLEARLARFGWGPRSAEMASLYFDRTIATSPASVWLFG